MMVQLDHGGDISRCNRPPASHCRAHFVVTLFELSRVDSAMRLVTGWNDRGGGWMEGGQGNEWWVRQGKQGGAAWSDYS